MGTLYSYADNQIPDFSLDPKKSQSIIELLFDGIILKSWYTWQSQHHSCIFVTRSTDDVQWFYTSHSFQPAEACQPLTARALLPI